MKNRSRLTRVIDDNVVDIIIIYDVRDVTTRALRCLNSFLLGVTRWRPTAAHAEALAIRDPLALKPAFVLALFRHRVFCKLLTASKRSLLIISIAVNEVVVLFLTLLGRVSLLGVI